MFFFQSGRNCLSKAIIKKSAFEFLSLRFHKNIVQWTHGKLILRTACGTRGPLPSAQPWKNLPIIETRIAPPARLWLWCDDQQGIDKFAAAYDAQRVPVPPVCEGRAPARFILWENRASGPLTPRKPTHKTQRWHFPGAMIPADCPGPFGL